MGKFRATTLALSAMVLFSYTSAPANAFELEREFDYLAKPAISTVLSDKRVVISDRVLLSGQGFTQVQEVFVDSNSATFQVLSDSKLEVEIPAGVNPGDAVLRISGTFGLLSYQGLFEVLPSSKLVESKITIGTFQGYAAVYTKNFKGYSLKISIADKERLIEELDSNYTQNLTKVGVGRTVTVLVYLGNKLVKSQEITIQ